MGIYILEHQINLKKLSGFVKRQDESQEVAFDKRNIYVIEDKKISWISRCNEKQSGVY